MKSKLVYVIYFLLIFLSIFTDCVWQNLFGYFGRSVLNFAIPVLFLLIIFLCKHVYMNTFLKQMWGLLFYLFFVGLMAGLIWKLSGYPDVVYGENIFIKAVKTDVYWLDIVMYMTSVYMCIRTLTQKEIWRPFVITFNFLFIYLIIEVLTMPYAVHIGAGAGIFYERVRLTTTESSLTVPMILIFGIGSIIYYLEIHKNKWKLFITFIQFIVFVITCESKTLFFIIVVYGLIYLFSYLRSMNRKKIQLLLFVFLGILIIGGAYGLKLINAMSRNRGSSGIRGLGILASLVHMFRYPFGVGGGIYLHTQHQCAVSIYNFLSQYAWFRQFAGVHVMMMINATSEADISCIAGIASQTLFWGLIGTMYWSHSLFKYIKANWEMVALKLRIWYKFLIVGILLMWGLFIPITNHYAAWGMIIIMFSKTSAKTQGGTKSV